ncbi:serine/threonine-protein kinase mTOR [Manduca sexta]|uniref:Serine/threonine-protein kinase TOR n=1 Tax=Manduca sexta TaxID=7130 RepID=A0A921Z6E0_MANSE|nr:serine/threonine-protein kinase mTOR [Manduca sexta]KAG6451388.1 hypothetical protein O3G_MSEX007124 [Manduca sexta]KAG6451389.1 hypothetical protein O3G_MSEX007124 [Manduca sexta]
MSNQVAQFVAGLKSRNVDVQIKTARELYHYAKTELREVPQEELTQFLDEFNHQIFEMVSSNDVHEKKGGVLAIVCLIGGDCDTTRTRITRFANYLRNLLPSSDVGVMELAAKTVGRLATVSGIKRAEYVEFEVKRAFEWLSEERNEGRRHSAVLLLKELAIAMPTYFYQQVSGFFDHILVALKDPKQQIREAAAKALRAGLVVTAQRETAKQSTAKPQWYMQCYEEAMLSFEDIPLKEKGITKEDRVHGGLLILNELLRCSNAIWEKKYTYSMHSLDTQKDITLSDDIIFISTKLHSPSVKRGYLCDGFKTENVQYPVPIYESAVCRKLLTEKFEKICQDIMAQRLLKTQGVPQILLIIIPRLAAFNKEYFLKKYLSHTMHYLISSLRSRERDRNMAFTTIGLMAAAIEHDIKNYIPRIMEVIKQALPVRDSQTKKRAWVDPSIFACITLLASSVKDLVVNDIKELLDAMFATGLSPSLTICLRELSQSLPVLKTEISEGLLKMLSLVLRNKPFLHPGVPSSLEQQMGNMNLVIELQDTPSIVLALRTLGTFQFEGQHSLLAFVRRCADHFLQSEQQEVRLEAVKTSAKLLADAKVRTMKTPSRTLTILTAEVIGKLLIVAVTDPEYEVRYWVLESLYNIFDTHLAQIENLSFLFMAMNDEHLAIRELAICTVGRLSTVNPAYVMPGLRKTLIQYLTELEHSGMSRNKEQAARMLDNLILHAPKLVKPYMETILNVLVPKLKESDSNPGVVISVLKAVGDLADVHGDNTGLKKCLPELLSILLDLLSDASATEKRSVALWAFGQLISATGYVVTPYTEYPNLMDVLLNFLKTEQQPKDRRETIRVLGLLGALDPYKHKMTRGLKPDSTLVPVTDSKAEGNNFDMTTSEMLVNMSSPVLDEYYPAIVISTLMRILRDPTLQQHHTNVVQAVTFIFQSLGIKCVPYISRVTPSLLYVARATDNNNFREFLFTQLARLIAIVKQHIRNYLDKIFDLIKEFWTPNSSLQPTLILLVEYIAVALGSEFKVYLPQLMPQILRVLAHDTSKDRMVTEKLLYALQKFEDNLDDYMHLVIPSIVKLFDASDCPINVAKVAMETVDCLSDSLNYSELVSRIIHPLVRSLDTCAPLRQTAMDTLCALIVQLGRKYSDFIPLVQKVVVKHRIQHQNYELLLSRLQSSQTLAMDEFLQSTRRKPRNNNQEARIVVCDTSQSIRKLCVNAHNLKLAWTVSSRVSKDDWLEWLRRFSIGLLTESHSPALRACLDLAHNYSQLLRDLFNAAFVSCWTELDITSRTELSNALEQALTAPDAPELAHTVLNLAEFMEHCEGGTIPISTHLLGERAMHCRAYAKALHYKEEEFRNGATSQVVEALIHINNKLQQKEAAEGLLERVMAQREAGDANLKVQIRWYEKLHNWEKALNLYGEKLSEDPDDMDAYLGELRCYEALGEWVKLYNTVSQSWIKMSTEEKYKAARLAAAAAWGLNEWDSMAKYVSFLPENTQDGAFYRAVLNIHNGEFDMSKLFIDQARSLLDSELTAVAGESYQRAYGALVNAQLLAELEEVITYKLEIERRESIRQAWWTRLQGGQRLVEDWRRILQVRSLVLTPQEDMATWLKFASLCRKSGAPRQAHKTLVMLLGSDPSKNRDKPLPTHEPRLTLAYAKHLWVAGDKQLAYDQLQRYVDNTESGDAEHCRLLARCHLKLGSWCESLLGINEHSIPTILRNYASATDLSSDWYKAWHAWAYMNFETVLFYKHQDTNYGRGQSGEKRLSSETIQQHTVPAVEGFFKSINLSHGSSLQDTLRLLTLWFDYGHYPAVHEALVEGIRTIEINVWLQVIPQLIARIDTPRALVGKLIHSLLIDIGKSHPQALVYPLTVASKSSFVARKNAANQILKSMCTHSSNLVNQAAMISEELIRVAILWHEQWHEALEEASRLYFSENDVNAMFKTLEPLHAMLERGPQTLKEVSFTQAYGRDLNEAQEWCNRYKESGQVRDLNQAWDLYYHVFRRISRQLPQLTSLELQYVSPRLLNCRDLELAVPGSYVPDQDLIRIAHIQSSLQVITSKQRPRRLCIRGSNGKDYMFLLKGHEDLRQDERVMQLFGLVNTLLQADPDTFRRDLAIQRYAVIPLSTNSGLIGWVPHCDTLHSLIRDYRDKRKCLLNIEHRIMQRMASDLDKLMLMQKVEVFEHALEHTAGDDLAKLLWLKSPSSEVWFERRTNYTRSLAVMSMVGYILGLGDRHPSNIMLDRVTGKFLHIDFGDCFEVAVTRDKFPEKIPFRLTRMLINAMEVTGIEGTYRRTCESVMEVLHRHKDSVMAVLEAFVYDPLLNWRLIDATRRSRADVEISSTSDPATSPQPSRSRVIQNDLNQPAETNLNKRALAIVNRVRDKLTGRDFPHIDEIVSVQKQVDLLIQQATSNENLCQCYVGWCPFW